MKHTIIPGTSMRKANSKRLSDFEIAGGIDTGQYRYFELDECTSWLPPLRTEKSEGSRVPKGAPSTESQTTSTREHRTVSASRNRNRH